MDSNSVSQHCDCYVMPVKISAGTPLKDDLFVSTSVSVLQTDRYKLCRVCLRINKSQLLKEVMHRLENESELLECVFTDVDRT